MAKVNLSGLSSDELYRLAQEREQQEAEEAKEAVRAQLDELRAERRDMIARHRKELAAIDSQIRGLGGRTARGKKRGSADGSVTDHVMQIVSGTKKISTKEIKTELENRGVVANNLAQTLAYLKRQGKVTSPSRSVYAPA